MLGLLANQKPDTEGCLGLSVEGYIGVLRGLGGNLKRHEEGHGGVIGCMGCRGGTEEGIEGHKGGCGRLQRGHGGTQNCTGVGTEGVLRAIEGYRRDIVAWGVQRGTWRGTEGHGGWHLIFYSLIS